MKASCGLFLSLSWVAALSGQSTYFAYDGTPASVVAVRGSGEFARVDIDADGLEDLAAIGGRQIQLGPIGSGRSVGLSGSILGFGFIDANANPDCICESGGSNVEWYEYDSQLGGMTRTAGFYAGGRVISILVDDFDANGLDDLVIEMENYRFSLWLNYGGQLVGPAQLFVGVGFRPYAVDYDTDGDLDLVVPSDSSQYSSWLENQGGAFFAAQSSLPGFASGDYCGWADIDGDGDSDLVVIEYPSQRLGWQENVGGGVGPYHVIGSVGAGRVLQGRVSISDLDLDGKPDVFVRFHYGQQIGAVAWWQNVGGGSFAGPYYAPDRSGFGRTYNDTSGVVIDMDIDGDGDRDFVGGAAGNSQYCIAYRNVGSGTAASAMPYGLGCGVPVMTLVPTSTAVVGASVTAVVQSTPTPICQIALGFSDVVGPGGMGLPADLAGVGMPGCFLYQSLDFTVATSPGPAAYQRSFSALLPPDGSLLGSHLYAQAFTLAPTSNALGVVMSNGVDFLIGGR